MELQELEHKKQSKWLNRVLYYGLNAMYEKYIIRQTSNIDEMKKNQNIKIPANFNYKDIKSLSNEEIEKLEKTKPENLHQASRIPGITPTSIISILEKIKK